MRLPHTELSRRLEPWFLRLQIFAGGLWLLLLATIIINVTLRYVIGRGYIELEELQWHLFATGFLVAIVHAHQSDAHVRVDVLHDRWPPRVQAWIELYGTLLLLLPFIALVLVYGIPYAWSSFKVNEISDAAGGLPLRWLIKAVLPLGFLLLCASTLSRLSRIWAYLFLTGPESSDAAPEQRDAG